MNQPSSGADDPRPAATLVILRDSDRGPQVLLTVRPKNLRFMGGAWVFPGGAVAPGDLDERWADAASLASGDAGARLGEPDGRSALAAHVCALRESFEEVGFVIGDGPIDRLPRDHAGDAARFVDDCIRLGVTLAADRLVPAGRWVTPLGSPIRFDTHFFVVRAPEDFEPTPDPSEVEQCRWLTPTEALVELSSGRALMAPPTIEMLQRLEGHTNVDGIVQSIRGGVAPGQDAIISTRLSPLVHVVLAPNPGAMTGPGTNTYVVGTGLAFVIDPATDDRPYLDAVRAAAPEVAAILVTHRHPDHIGGVAALAASTGAPVRAFGDAPAGGVTVVPVRDGEVLEAGGARLTVLHAPGHASDHVCFLLAGAASLFAGDNILGEGTAVIAPPDGNMRAYLETLGRLRALHIDRIYPGHFRPLDGGRKVIEDYIEHRRERERAIVEALARGLTTLDDVVARAYRDTPATLHPIARFSALAHLEMLEEDGRVERTGDTWELRTTG